MEPVNTLVKEPCKHREIHGPTATQIAYEAALTEKGNLEKLIADKEAEMKSVKAANARADKIGEELSAKVTTDSNDLKRWKETGEESRS